MPELLRSKHQVIEYIPEHSIIKRVLTGGRDTINWPEHQQEWLEYARLLHTYKPRNILVDARQFDYLLLKDIQDWINSNVIKVFNDIGLKKWAMLIPPQFLNQVSIEQTMEANPSNTFESRYFEAEPEALRWLLEKNVAMNKMN
jgi:hypothetical protein